METSNTKTSASATSEQPAGVPTSQRKGGFIRGAVAAQGCCGTTGSGTGCCGEPVTATTTATSAPAAKPAATPVAAQSGCCGSSASSCCG